MAPRDPDPRPPRKRRSAPTAAQALANANKATKGIKVGRPRTYSPALCERAVALGMQGKSWAGIAAEFNISRSTLNAWEREFPAFTDALARARVASQAWWENKVRSNLKAKHFQAQAMKPFLYAHFRDDYQEVRNQVNVAIGGDLLDAITEATQSRTKALSDRAKPVEAQDVVLDAPKRDT